MRILEDSYCYFVQNKGEMTNEVKRKRKASLKLEVKSRSSYNDRDEQYQMEKMDRRINVETC